jgi:hypothetical protein
LLVKLSGAAHSHFPGRTMAPGVRSTGRHRN